jgi:hypothetical protein
MSMNIDDAWHSVEPPRVFCKINHGAAATLAISPALATAPPIGDAGRLSGRNR